MGSHRGPIAPTGPPFPPRVTAEAARGYLVARLARDYAAAGRALSEVGAVLGPFWAVLANFVFFWGGFGADPAPPPQIQARDPDFAPRTLLDFGSGLGATCW